MRRYWIIALSLSNLCFFRAWREVLSPQGFSFLYYWKEYPGYSALIALVINVVLLAAIFFVANYLIVRSGSRWWRVLGQLIFLLVFLRALNNIRSQFESFSTSHIRLLISRSGYVVLVAMLISLIVLTIRLYGLRRVAHIAAIITLVLSPFGLVGLIQATWISAKYGYAVKHERAAAPAFDNDRNARPRVLWLIFDEMDQDVSFVSRPEGLKLPQFDRLRSEALIASNAYPPAGHTSQSIPALLTGRLISAVQPVAPNELLLSFPSPPGTARWSEVPDVFSEARGLGMNTALVGWYHPYCRIIGDRLTACNWEPGTQRLDPAKLSLKKNLLREEQDLLRLLPFSTSMSARLFTNGPRDYRREHLTDYLALMREAESVVVDRKFGLLFIHLSVPHPPYIYDRAGTNLTTTGESSYLDNLALADKALGQLRSKMEQAGVWEQTTVVVSSDHWWRSDYWRSRIFRSASDPDERRVDHRVPFILRLAKHDTTLNYNAPFNTVLTHDLILEILQGRIAAPEQAASWLDLHRTIGESPYQNYEDVQD